MLSTEDNIYASKMLSTAFCKNWWMLSAEDNIYASKMLSTAFVKTGECYLLKITFMLVKCYLQHL